MANLTPDFLSDHHSPRRTDTLWAIQQKILGALIDNGSGGGGGGTNFNLQGDVAPTNPPAEPTEPYDYWDRVTGILWHWNTDAQAWQ